MHLALVEQPMTLGYFLMLAIVTAFVFAAAVRAKDTDTVWLAGAGAFIGLITLLCAWGFQA